MVNWLYDLIYSSKDKEISDLKNQIEKLKDINPKRDYYNNKYPTTNISYNREEKSGIYKIDVRKFIQPNDFNLPNIVGDSDDEKALNSLIWVIQNITYTSDKKQEGIDEYWAFPHETYTRKKGDCEDGSLLLASIMIKNKIPEWKIRISAGYVTNPTTQNKEGHCYLTYYCEEKDKWVCLDWCYAPNTLSIIDRKDYKDESIYSNIWFSFNNINSFGSDADIRKASKYMEVSN